MYKIVNALWWIGDLFKGFAVAIKKTGPSYKSMIAANKRGEFLEEIDNMTLPKSNQLNDKKNEVV